MAESTPMSIRVFEDEKVEITPDQIRLFVREMAGLNEKIKEARDALKEAIESSDEINQIDEEIKSLKDRRKEIISTNAVLVAYKAEYDEAVEERKQLISDAKSDGIPKKEIDTAIQMLKKDIDPNLTTEVFTNIADLV